MAINYTGYQQIRNAAQGDVTAAKHAAKQKADAEAEAARIARSKKRSTGQKLGSAIARGAAAYYTGGASEALGFGGMIDDAILGKDAEGNRIENEYGGLVNRGSAVYNYMDSAKDKDIAKLRAEDQSQFESDREYANTFEKGSPEYNDAIRLAISNKHDSGKRQDYSGREDTNAFLYKSGRNDPSSFLPEVPSTTLDNSGDPRIKVTAPTALASVPDTQSFEQKQIEEGRELKKGIDESFKAQNLANHGPSLAEVESMYDRDRKLADLANARDDREDSWVDGLVKEESDIKRGLMNKRTLEGVDREYNKIGEFGDQSNRFKSANNGISLAELESNQAGKGIDFKASPMSKTYLEEEVVRDDTTNALDDLAQEPIDAKYADNKKQLAEARDTNYFLRDKEQQKRVEWDDYAQKQKDELAAERDAIEKRRLNAGGRPPQLSNLEAKHKALLGLISEEQLNESFANIGGILAGIRA